MLTAEQLLAAQKANVETLFDLTNKAFEGMEKLVELNLQVAKTSLGEAAETTKTVLSVKDAQELMSLQAGLLQPAAEKAAAYSRHLYDIAAATGAELHAGSMHTAPSVPAHMSSSQSHASPTPSARTWSSARSPTA